jgi:hypothetical protein
VALTHQAYRHERDSFDVFVACVREEASGTTHMSDSRTNPELLRKPSIHGKSVLSRCPSGVCESEKLKLFPLFVAHRTDNNTYLC